MAKKKKTGGRNPVEPAEKVILVGFYAKQKFIDAVGGMEEARNIARLSLLNEAQSFIEKVTV